MAASTPKYGKSEKDRRFHEALEKLASTVPFISLNPNGKKQIAFLARFSKLPPTCSSASTEAAAGIRKEWNCRECWRRVDRLFPFMDATKEGPLIYQFGMAETLTTEQAKMVEKKTEFLSSPLNSP